ncbi:F-box domain containing protein [Pandoravirus dulcis]|uniref:F-box domain containing protein n=1 Tax=Pandoravirus dulcis TaxID=1349409 RepID=S4VXA7_9VIRU|nr:F-box domain containing protein [Pandoravirus dulcis]AGO82716.1 F-box domain containing protein [Pandoravirus dulcis]
MRTTATNSAAAALDTPRLDDESDGVADNGMLGALPAEILVRILNGHESTRRGWKRRARPLLDPRWRFVARAVCRLWRDVIEHPSAEDVAAMGAHPHKRWNQVHQYTPVGCPKWPSGRVVCMTAVADWIRDDPAPWTGDPDSLYTWCRSNARASRKHVVAALLACGAPWAMEQVFDHHWPRLAYVSSRAPVALQPADADDPPALHDHDDDEEDNDGFRASGPASARQVGEYDDWDIDRGGDIEGLVEVLRHLALARGLGDAHRMLCNRFGYEESSAYLSPVIDGGHAQLLGDLIAVGSEMPCYYWSDVIKARDTACLAKLLDLGLPYIPSRHRRSRLPLRQTHGDEPAWIDEAAAAGNVGALALCDARNLPFDANAAFVAAAAANRPCVMQWLWDRQAARQRRARSSDSVEDVPSLDEDAAVVESIVREHFKSKRRETALSWLLDERRWTPRASHPTLNLDALIERACQRRAVRCALMFAERWPHTFFDGGIDRALRILGLCREEPDGLESLLRMLALFDRYAGDPASMGAPNLWAGLFASHPMPAHYAESLARHTAQWARVVYALSINEAPTEQDMSAFWERPDEPCACTRHPLWEHVDGTFGERPDTRTWCDVVARMAPIRRWLRPVALPAATILPDVAQALPRAHRQMIDWLAERRLLSVDDPNAALSHADD